MTIRRIVTFTSITAASLFGLAAALHAEEASSPAETPAASDTGAAAETPAADTTSGEAASPAPESSAEEPKE